MATNKLLMAPGDTGPEVAKGVSFDGANDYLVRNSDFVGNEDGNAFTFSAWVYLPESDVDQHIYWAYDGSQGGIRIYRRTSDEKIAVEAYSSSAQVLNITSGSALKSNTWYHILLSVNLASTSNKSLYIHEQYVGLSVSTYNTAGVIDFTKSAHYCASATGTEYLSGRISNVFLDYTYRDLSVEANRRLFITEDLKPAENQAALNPIMYLPMDDADTAHVNLGTGGDFTAVGVLDTAQRGANQWNCVASRFDGTDYLQSSTSEIAYDKLVVSFISTMNSNGYLRFYSGSGADPFISINTLGSAPSIQISQFSPSYINMGSVGFPEASNIGVGTTHQFTAYIDVSGGKCQTYVDGYSTGERSVTFQAGTPQFSSPRLANISNVSNSVLGEFFLDTNDIDLSSGSIFWDYENNSPKPVRQVIEETGITPLYACPIDSLDPYANYGTLGEFSLSGSLSGVRGMSEAISRSFYGASTTKGSNSMTLTGVNLGATSLLSGVVAFRHTGNNTYAGVFGIGNASTTGNSIGIMTSGDTPRNIQTLFGSYSTSGALGPAGTLWNIVMFHRTQYNQIKWYCYNQDGDFWENTSEYSPSLNLANVYVGTPFTTDATKDHVGEISTVYLVNQNIDFSQEENRHLFIDQLGYPKDLSKQIEDGLIPEPLVYLPFDDPDDLGKNLGTAGDFTINGTITQNGDFYK